MEQGGEYVTKVILSYYSEPIFRHSGEMRTMLLMELNQGISFFSPSFYLVWL